MEPKIYLKDDEIVQTVTEIFEEFVFSEHPDELANAKNAQELIALIPPEKLVEIVQNLAAIIEHRLFFSDGLGDYDGL